MHALIRDGSVPRARAYATPIHQLRMVNAFLAQQRTEFAMRASLGGTKDVLLLGSAELASALCPWRLHLNR